MTLVRIALDVPGPTGNTRATARIRATPTRRRTVGDAVVLPSPFTVALVDGVATLDLAATSAGWAWRIDEQTFSVSTTRYVTVPDTVETLGYEDLADVDPATLEPTAEPEAAWTVELAAVAASGVQYVTVTTGTEARPIGAGMVIWRDKRQDQSVRPVNMGQDDWWELIPTPDTTSPTAPTGLASSGITATGFTVTWTASTDNVGVTGYDVRVDGGAPVTEPSAPQSVTFTDRTASTAYTVEIRARDAAGNVSAYVPIVVTTSAGATTFSVFGASAPTGSWTLGTDGTPTIVFARGFYKFNSADATNGLPTARVVGGRAWLPATGAMPTEATFRLYGPTANLETVAVQTKVVAIPSGSESSWIEATFDTPQSMGSDGAIWMIGVEFTGAGDAGKYVFGTTTRAGSASVQSTSGKNFVWAEQDGVNAALSSQFRIGTGTPVTPAEQTQSYGVDILIDEGA